MLKSGLGKDCTVTPIDVKEGTIVVARVATGSKVTPVVAAEADTISIVVTGVDTGHKFTLVAAAISIVAAGVPPNLKTVIELHRAVNPDPKTAKVKSCLLANGEMY